VNIKVLSNMILRNKSSRITEQIKQGLPFMHETRLSELEREAMVIETL